ncbi:hypothetical protein [Methanoculleus formosensis]|uniref:hypothetical protein n=1 Tax=Methanoculleus formosensis TaxID=2590886 RepID=UPI0021BF55F1|nr:hypothetical protein [Methanoculleus sp. Afa-1]
MAMGEWGVTLLRSRFSASCVTAPPDIVERCLDAGECPRTPEFGVAALVQQSANDSR